jgi:hypothetical protein
MFYPGRLHACFIALIHSNSFKLALILYSRRSPGLLGPEGLRQANLKLLKPRQRR